MSSADAPHLKTAGHDIRLTTTWDEMTLEQREEYLAQAKAEHQQRVDDALHNYQSAIEACIAADRAKNEAEDRLVSMAALAEKRTKDLEHAKRLLFGTIRGGFEGACFVKSGAKQ